MTSGRDRRRGGAPLRRDRRSRGDGREGPIAVVGRRPALEAVRSGRAIEVLVAQEARSTAALREVVEAAGASDIPVVRVPGERIESLADGALHQGVAARVRPVARLAETDLASRDWAPDSVVVAIDGVTDPQNLGALARTVEAAGAEALITRRRRAAHLQKVAIKASAGALLHLPVAEVANIPRALSLLKEAGFWVVGMDESAETSIFEEEPTGRLAIVLGAEGTGLSRLVRASCDELLAIPIRGKVASLNVSVAAGVALFAYAMRGKEKKGT
ncbi:MAG: 23S rRNA (guanosine(2251)-2'-O)-methyltransferase RlmB [Actinomycetota bacterium]